MSVGAGSIKRAAKAAEGSTEVKAVEGSTEVKAAKSAESGAETKAAKSAESSEGAKAAKTAKSGVETKPGKTVKGSVGTKTVKKEASKKSAGEKGNVDDKTSVVRKPVGTRAEIEKDATAYVAYGIGQELPVHLM